MSSRDCHHLDQHWHRLNSMIRCAAKARRRSGRRRERCDGRYAAADLPAPLRNSRTSGWGRGCGVRSAACPPRKLRPLLRLDPGGSPDPSFERKLLGLAQASNSIPATGKCSIEQQPLDPLIGGSAAGRLRAISPSISLPRFFVKFVAFQTGSSLRRRQTNGTTRRCRSARPVAAPSGRGEPAIC